MENEVEVPIEIELGRSWRGLSVRIKTKPEIEEFMKTLGNGELYEVRLYGRYWKPHGGSEMAFRAYDLTVDPGPMTGEDGKIYEIGALGKPLLERRAIIGSSRTTEILNMSFLRLVGSSVGEGITFTIKDLVTKEQMIDLRERIQGASGAFYTKYLKPINYTVMICTQER